MSVLVRASVPRSLRCALVALAGALAVAAPAVQVGAQQSLIARRAGYVVRFSSGPLDLEGAPAALRQTLTLDLGGVSVDSALRELASRAGISLTYSRAVVPLDRTVSVHVANGSVLEAFRQILGDARVELWVSAEGRMALVPLERERRTAHVDAGTITGTVTEATSHAPIVGATITVADTRLGATTGNDGRYAVANVPAGAHKIFAQRIGFGRDSQVVVVTDGQSTTADFALQVRAVQLNEVVAIGYGTTERRELTGSVSSISSDQLADAPVQSVDQALLGRAPGVQVVSSSGQPGAGAMVRIRGGNSINAGNDPLYVIDGVPVLGSANQNANTGTIMSQSMSGIDPLAALNPDDIQSIEVLKDASATAIYGARAANGVVLITTKRGRTGRSTVTFNTYYGTQQVRHKLDVLNATQFANMVNQAYTNGGQVAPYSQSDITSFGAGTNWQDAIFRDAPVANYNLAISGGNPDTKFFLSGDVLRNQGVVIGTNLDRASVRLNLDQSVSSKLDVGTRLTFTHSQGQVMPNGGAGQEVPSVVLNALQAPPTIPIHSSGGEYFTGVNQLTGRPFSNPVASALEITNEERQNRGVGNVFGEYHVSDALSLRSSLGMDYLSSIQNFYSPANTLPGRNYGGYGSRGEAAVTNWLNENTITYKRHVGAKSDADVVGGVTFQRTTSETISGTAEGFLTDNLRQNGLSNASTFVGVWTGYPHSSLLSYFARGNWNYADRYLLTVTGRVDGSSKFGSGNQYGFFPSAALAWRASNEDFIRSLGVFDDLKFRVSYGRTGNQDIGNYASLATLGSTVYTFGGTRGIGFAPSSLANPNLKWETTDQFDAGVDAAFIHNRLFVTVDGYDKKTHDLLLYVPVPATSGFNSSLQNIGSVGNKGLELAINTINLTGALGWESQLNLAWNRNKVLNLGPNTQQIINPVGVGAGANQNPTILQVGQPTNAFYGWVFDHMDNGVVVYKDLNNDGAITSEDETIIGNAQPNYTGGLNNRLTWKNLDLSVFLQWSVGNKIYNINKALMTSGAGNANQLAVEAQGGNGIPTPKIGNTFDSNPSDLFVEDGSYLRGKNIRLGFTVPQRWIQGARVGSLTNAQLYVSAQNFFTSTKYTGFDPEVSEYALSNLAQGIDFGTYPQTRQFTVGLTLGF